MMSLANYWQDFNLLVALLVMLTYIVVDGMYAYYTIAVTNRNAFSSATTGAIMHFLIAFGVLNYVNNYLYILPIAVGSWIGTYIVIKYQKPLK